MPGEQPDAFAMRMAETKAGAVSRTHSASWVIGADTVIALEDGTILGKPADEAEAMAILGRLNNATHRVMTGMHLCCRDRSVAVTLVETTEVTFMDNAPETLKAYIRTGEPMDKAGAYGIQGMGGMLVESISGSCTNVIGLPLSRLIRLLMEHQVISPAP